MVAPACTDEEFIRLFRTLGALKTAQHLGVSERNVYARRRSLEKKFGSGMLAPTEQFYRHAPERHPRKHFELDSGVALVFSDAHFWPGVRTCAFRALLLFIKELKPKLIVCNGDAFDGASISRFPRIGWDSKPSVNEELRACQDRLAEIEDIANGAKLFWPLGNHDSRFETMLAQNAPQYEGVKGFSLKDHCPNWEPCWSLWVNNDVVIKHRLKNGVHATRNNTLAAGMTTFTGHLHQLKVAPLDDYRGTRWGVDTGTLADPGGPQFVDYTEDGILDWRSGFAIATFWNGELLWPELCRVKDKGHVDFRGTVIAV